MKRYLLVPLCLTLSAAQGAGQTTNIAWGVTANNVIFHYNGTGWAAIPSPNMATVVQVSSGFDGTVWALDANNNIYSYNGTGWQGVTGSLVQVSVVSSTSAWGVNGNNTIYQWNGTGWNQIDSPANATAKQVSAAADGTVWALDSNGNIYAYGGGSVWRTLPGNLAQLSLGSINNAWGVNGGNAIYQWNGTVWNAIASPANATARQVSVGPDGTAYLIDTQGNIYTWSGTGWQGFPGLLAQISGGYAERYLYNNAAVVTQGAWAAQTNTSAFAGGYLQDATTGDSITIKFLGDSIALYRLLDTNGGQATLTVDGANMGVFDFYFPQQRWQVPAVLDHLGAGAHTLVLTVAGTSNAASAGKNVYIDTFAAPAPFFPSIAQQSALSRVNYYRNLANVPPATLNKALDLAAQAHTVYNAILGADATHVEDPGRSGFVGVNPPDRSAYFGYSDQLRQLGAGIVYPVTEDGSGGPTGIGLLAQGQPPDPAVIAAQSIDGWIGTVYHRFPILAYPYNDIGYGQSGQLVRSYSFLEFGPNRGAIPPNTLTIPYPANNQTNIPTSFLGGEVPNPLPDGIQSSGYPITLQIIQGANVTKGTSTNPAVYQLSTGGNQVLVYVVQNTGTDSFCMLPQQPLNLNATYNARIAGTDSQGNPFDVSWSFSTIPAATVTSSNGSLLPQGYTIAWTTAGAVTATSVNYGPTTAYGSTVQGKLVGDTTYNATLPGLTMGTYHYQITAMDAAGGSFTSPDMTFTITTANNQITIDIVAPSNILRNVEEIHWHTFGPVTSTQVNYGTTTAYGSVSQGTAEQSPFANAYGTLLTRLTAGQTYHFQVAATDAQGNTATTPDQTFTVPQSQ